MISGALAAARPDLPRVGSPGQDPVVKEPDAAGQRLEAERETAAGRELRDEKPE